MTEIYSRYAAIGDSFTEGVGDELPDGRVRGWADLVALGLALASPTPVSYANLAIRGRLLAPIVDEQLDAAIALSPALISINGGGNDIMRPRVSITSITDQLESAVDRAASAGIHVVLASGANPTRHLPLGSFIEARGDRLADAIRTRLPKENVTFVDNWADQELSDIRFWSRDKLHLNSRGHERVASNVLAALGVTIPDARDDHAGIPAQRTADYWRQYVLPWIGRRVTGRSSGDNRQPKYATLTPVELPRP
ncbi:lysophospholipase L1-like esterase [Glaciihabitans tibetensis]|uniref:Lysophospholipase L1-like esterase n=1 Tax=Glaciihabitans tibetensis TaxID=1266600 RepID=A0A2T0VFP1_9MICO|nr:SGNH/GDSL hydrolase family protein [Glaciihabitans tibetensis]PRY69028.1 lysophospholipase L1-like esterase [Glaciihabitans tibetensis]